MKQYIKIRNFSKLFSHLGCLIKLILSLNDHKSFLNIFSKEIFKNTEEDKNWGKNC